MAASVPSQLPGLWYLTSHPALVLSFHLSSTSSLTTRIHRPCAFSFNLLSCHLLLVGPASWVSRILHARKHDRTIIGIVRRRLASRCVPCPYQALALQNSACGPNSQSTSISQYCIPLTKRSLCWRPAFSLQSLSALLGTHEIGYPRFRNGCSKM